MTQNRIRELFDRVIESPVPAREELLDRVCGDEPELRAAVESLLVAHDRAGQFLADPTVPVDRLFPDVAAVGSRVGPYTLLRLIGEGGYGTVYEAEQHEPLHRKVALKVIKAGMDTRQVIARFARERQTLALMAHANIARVLDAGTTAQGRSYFVMELVEGEPITSYCRGHRLGIRRRLSLFAAVCNAVQHAHQKSVIHRDLKPANVLVTMQDGQPMPKVIDFGIAKALHASGDSGGQTTEQPYFLGTLPYMSPEQARGAHADLDTRCDIYSLGALLYELLADASPFDPERLRSATCEETRRIIREVDPPPPSVRLAESAASSETRRRVQEIRGDLDWIVMKAMEKDRDRRYGTAEALAADILRYLSVEPVTAGPPTGFYRLRKFARRNRRVLVTVVVVFAALAAGLAAAGVGLVRARQSARAEAAERHRADEQRIIAEANAEKARKRMEELLAAQRAVYSLLVPDQDDGRTMPREVLDFIATRANDGRLSGSPASEASVRAALGRGYMSLNRWGDAAREFRRATDVQREFAGASTPDIAAFLGLSGECLMRQGEYDEALRLLDESMDIYAKCGFHIAPIQRPENIAALLASRGESSPAETEPRFVLGRAAPPLKLDAFALFDTQATVRDAEQNRSAADLLRLRRTLFSLEPDRTAPTSRPADGRSSADTHAPRP
ncbi:MAG: serine/threonine-protein kinase [Tepidisphaerales bacterium]